MRLQACLNGARTPRDHPGVPMTPQALARDAAACRRAGAESLHVHPRDAAGRETLAAADVARALEAIRAAVPDMPVGISTGAWIAPGGSARLAPMRAWTVLPDFVSVNVHEPEAEAIVALMQARGIAIEAGLWTRGRGRALRPLADAALQPAGAGRDDRRRSRKPPRPRSPTTSSAASARPA